MKYRKRPIIIDAWRWNETRKLFKEIGCKYIGYKGHEQRLDEMRDLKIKTLEGAMNVNKGDYIIKGIVGEFYPCKPDIFEKTYEKLITKTK